MRGFLNWPLFSFGDHYYSWAEYNGVELRVEARCFRKELRLKILKLWGLAVLVHQLLKFNRVLLQERSILHFPLLSFWKPVRIFFLKIAFKSALILKRSGFLDIFKGEGIDFILSQTFSFKALIKFKWNPPSLKICSWVFDLLPLAIGKTSFINAAVLILALSSLIMGFQGAIAFKYSHISAPKYLIMPRHSAQWCAFATLQSR